MKNVFVFVSLFVIQASALPQKSASTVNFNDPALTRDCWKRHAAGGDISQSRMIRPDFQAPVNTVEKTAKSLRTI